MAQMDFRIQGNQKLPDKRAIRNGLCLRRRAKQPGCCHHSLGLFTVHVSFLMVFKMVLQGRCCLV